MTVEFVGANNPKLTKISASQKTSTTRKGVGIEPPDCSNKNERFRASSDSISRI